MPYAFDLTGAMAAAVVLAVPCLDLVPAAGATEAYAAQTGQACAQCHTAGPAGGPLTPYGMKFKENGKQVPKAARR
jgi:mono/diheme cytochrome c family protein